MSDICRDFEERCCAGDRRCNLFGQLRRALVFRLLRINVACLGNEQRVLDIRDWVRDSDDRHFSSGLPRPSEQLLHARVLPCEPSVANMILIRMSSDRDGANTKI